MELVIEAGAEDLRLEDDQFVVETPPDALHTVQRALERGRSHRSRLRS
jgi:transcriptional/translational regulatory protein YebC/TACO1